MEDDREQFERDRRSFAKQMGADSGLRDRGMELLVESAKYNYTYLWHWLGLPIIQLPADIVATQEIIWEQRPDVIVETGVARGGSLLLSASILQLLGHGTVVGVDIDIRAHNRSAIEDHPLAHRIQLIEGSSVASSTLERVKEHIAPGNTVMVILDSDHSHDHVLAELRLYGELVTPGQFLIVADTALGVPQAERFAFRKWPIDDNPMTALEAYLQETAMFEQDAFCNQKLLLTSSPGGYLRRRLA